MRLLLTRPQDDGERTAARLRARGHHVTLAPLLRVEPVEFELPHEPLSAVVMTSANAARALARHPRREALVALPAFTVGRHTAEAARAAGFRDVECADGDKDDLAALLRARWGERSAALLYLAGEDRAGDLAAGGVPLRTAVAYRAVKVGALRRTLRRRWRRVRSTAYCIFPAAARRPTSIAPRAWAVTSARSPPCTMVSPARSRSRSPPPAPPRSASRRTLTKPP